MKYFISQESKSLGNVQSKDLQSLQKSTQKLKKSDRKWSLRRGKSWYQAEKKTLMDMPREYLDDTQVTHLCDDFSMTVNCAESEGAPTISDNVSGMNYQAISSKYKPNEMRCLALIAHNNMKPAMKAFVRENKDLLKNFRMTGTDSTMTMLKTMFDDQCSVEYGPTFTSGPLGGDAQVGALMCLEDLGGIIFFMDPMSSHPHEADITSLIRLANVHNVPIMTNPTAAHAFTHVLKQALAKGAREMIPSFFYTLESPSVAVYKESQRQVVEKSIQ